MGFRAKQRRSALGALKVVWKRRKSLHIRRAAQWGLQGEAVGQQTWRGKHVASEIIAGILRTGEHGRHEGNNAAAGEEKSVRVTGVFLF